MDFYSEKGKRIKKENELLNELIKAIVEQEGVGAMNILMCANDVFDKTGSILEYVRERMIEFDEDKERATRYIEFLKGINNLYDEFIKAEMKGEA